MLNPTALSNQLFNQAAALSHPTVPAVRPLRQDLSRQLKTAGSGVVLDLAWEIIARSTAAGNPDLRWVAFELIHYHQPAMDQLDYEILEELGSTLDSWDSVDAFALYLSGPAWRDCRITDTTIHSWAASPNLWQRRAALVSTVALNNHARGDVPRTLAVCRRLTADRDDLVIKAMSWALRELVKYDPAAVAHFLTEHDDTLAARVKREVRHKLTTGRKNPPR